MRPIDPDKGPRTAMDILAWLQSGKPHHLFMIYYRRDGRTVRMWAIGTERRD